MKSSTCLQPNEIECLLENGTTSEHSRSVELHLAECATCRERVERSIGSKQWWSNVQTSLADNRDDWGHTEDHVDAKPIVSSKSHQGLLGLLGPTDDPEKLGRIGNYEVSGLLGQGGMGVVFKAFDRSLNRYVAIKMLLPHLASSAAARQRFAREAQAAAAIVDDHVMPVHYVGEWQGIPYLVMTYSKGMSLQRRLDDDGPLKLAEILRIGMQAAKGLAAAHAQGLVHRDIKPANIFLAENVERVQLMDFGLARAADDASMTRTGILAGTPQYMSPEQARAEKVDWRSDLFSLGSVLYTMCTGRPPFRADSSHSILRLITDKPPRPIQEVNPEIPIWLCRIVETLMAKDAANRYRSAADVAELLASCLAHVQEPTSTPLPAELSQNGIGIVGKLIAFGFFALFAVFGFAWWDSSDPPNIEGQWSSKTFGQILLEQGRTPNRVSGTFSLDDQSLQGTINLKWSRMDERFHGTWRQGSQNKGQLSLRPVEGGLAGAFTANQSARTELKLPKLADFEWTKKTESQPVASKLMDKGLTDLASTWLQVLRGSEPIAKSQMEFAAEILEIRKTKDPKKITFVEGRAAPSGRVFFTTNLMETKDGNHVYALAVFDQQHGSWRMAVLDVEPTENLKRDIEDFLARYPNAQPVALPSETSIDLPPESFLAWKSTSYVAPNSGFFPDDKDAGAALDRLYLDPKREHKSDQEILETVRAGFRHTKQHQTLVLSWIGNKYIWGKSPQNPEAIELMYHATDFDGSVMHYAVYYGLSVVQSKSPNILRSLAELCVLKAEDGDTIGRVAWGCCDQKDALLEYLKPFESPQFALRVRKRAEDVLSIFNGELSASVWEQNQFQIHAKNKYQDKLPEMKRLLVEGDSEERKQILNTILADRVYLIMDDSFVQAFVKCAEDSSKEVRKNAVIIVGEHWVWRAQQQNQAAIDWMLTMSEDPERSVKYNAVYYGLSVVRDKTDSVIQRLLEIAITDREPNLYGRIKWGIRSDKTRALEMLQRMLLAAESEALKKKIIEVHDNFFGVDRSPIGARIINARQRYDDLKKMRENLKSQENEPTEQDY